MTNRNEVLAKLLGIKSIVAMCRNGRQCDDAVADCLNCEKRDSKVREIYPDFEEPSNFVRLLELRLFKTQTLLENVMRWSFDLTRDIDSVYSFVEAIENYIHELKEQQYDALINEICKQAQQVKWSY